MQLLAHRRVVGCARQAHCCLDDLSAAVAQGGIGSRVVAIKPAKTVGKILGSRHFDAAQPLHHTYHTLGVAQQCLAKFSQGCTHAKHQHFWFNTRLLERSYKIDGAFQVGDCHDHIRIDCA